MHMIMEYCPHGDIMHLNEESLSFTPPDVLLSHLPPVGLDYEMENQSINSSR